MNIKHSLCAAALLFVGGSVNAQMYYSDDFSSASWKDNYDMTASQNFKHVNSGCYSGSCIQVTVLKDSHYGGSAKYKLKENLGFEPEEMYAEYRVKYNDSMKLYGGKAPGFDGTYGEAGWGNRPGYGTKGWSARGTLKAEGRSDVRNSFYIYHTDTGNNGKTWGDARWWNDDGNMDFNRWYHVKQYVKLNTPGQSNGILRAWVDGVKVFEKTNFNFRTTSDLKIYAYWINYYNGGSDEAKATGTLLIDDLRLYGANGPGNSTPSPSPTPTLPVTPNQSAYVNHFIPGRIQAEDYDIGGQGIAYSDANNGNSGGAYRPEESVDVQSSSDGSDAYNVGWTSAGEWLEYSVADIAAGNYDVKLRVAASGSSSGKKLIAKLDGQTIAEFNFSGTNGWQNWKTITLKNIRLNSASNKILRLEFETGAFNVNWIEFVAAASAPIETSFTVQAENFSASGGSYGGFETYTTSSGVGGINFNQRGDWADYEINVPVAGEYRLDAWLATTQTGGAIELFVNGQSLLKESVVNNGNWDQFVKTSSSGSVYLQAGVQTIRVQSSGNSSTTWEWNADKFVFEKLN
ncbi:carbohydrate-binding protein [Agaribacterium sp. ZY112]|uniref:carbohydrate-binding protein n=1 Tax=Agaribacterium sp. ZY112 TaxID=3233574 RepID=UPI00352524F8